MITTVTPNVALDKYYLIPGFALHGVHRVEKATVLPSGKGLNVARVLHHYGIPSLSTGVVAGFTGRQICHLLNKTGQQHDFIWADGESRLCLTVMDPVTNVHTEILEHGPVYTAELEAKLEAKVQQLAKTSTWVAISGNPPTGTAADLLYRLVKIAKAADAQVLLDARGGWLRLGVKAIPHIIKPNWQEFEDLTGPCASCEIALVRAHQLIEAGIKLVIISMGAAGALAITAESAWQITPPKVQLISPVGCGDALVGGLLTAFTQGHSLTESLRFATAVAASNACHFGAGEFDLQQVEEFLSQVVIEHLA